MSSTFGKNLELTVFGESHSEGIGMTLSGIPAGEKVDMDALQMFMDRRAPGKSSMSTARKEADIPRFLSGIADGVTCGTPIAAVIENTDVRSSDYDDIKNMPRPGHADYTAHIKYGGHEDYRGGGHFSGRLTAPICIAGGIIKQILERKGITVEAEIAELAGIEVTDESSRKEAFDRVEELKKEGDSAGGIISCEIKGLPAGLGGPMFDGVENVISKAVFGVPAVKGIEFGAGFKAASMKGSENNDPFRYDEDGNVVTTSNNAGGILGGITDGMPVTFRVAMKPTPSIAKEQETVGYNNKDNVKIKVKGRHDPCVAVRAVPVIDAVAAIAVYDLILGD